MWIRVPRFDHAEAWRNRGKGYKSLLSMALLIDGTIGGAFGLSSLGSLWRLHWGLATTGGVPTLAKAWVGKNKINLDLKQMNIESKQMNKYLINEQELF